MTREFASYLLTLSDLGKTIWLRIYADSAPNGTAIINEKDLPATYGVSSETLGTIFKPDLAHKKKLVNVMRTETRLVINFGKRGRKTNIDKAIAKEEPNLPATIDKSIQKTDTIKTGEVIIAGPQKWKFTHELRVKLIEDYILFFKSRQVQAALLVGADPNKIHVLPPKIGEIEIVNLKYLAQYFHNAGCPTDDHIIRAFRKMYNFWDDLQEFYRKSVSPQAMYRNINEIINQIKTHNPTNKQSKKDVKFNSKIEATEHKDYSRLERKGKKDN